MKTLRTALRAGVALGIIGAGAPALAQDAAAGPAVPDSDIIVTARRTEERLQDVPISITVFNQAQLTQRNVNSAVDLAAYTPSLSANPRFGTENATFSIRGFDQAGRTTSSVGIYFADVISPRGGNNSISTADGAGPGSFFDLQNVQVLKGPQGTLFGRNTTGGAVLLVPQKPTGRFEGYVEGSVGNYDMRRIQAVVNVPLGDTARFRIGVDRQTRDGFLHNNSGIGPANLSDTDYYAVRASLVADLTPNLENYTIVSYSQSDTTGTLPKVTNCSTAAAVQPFGDLSCQQIARQDPNDFYSVQNSYPTPNQYLRTWQIINTTTWKASDNLTIKNIASYSNVYSILRGDLFGAQWVIPATVRRNVNGVLTTFATGAQEGQQIQFNNVGPLLAGGTNADQENFTTEFQLQGRSFGDKLVWQAGAYVELSDPLGTNSSLSSNNLVCPDRDRAICSDPLGQVFGVAQGSQTYQNYRALYHDYGLYAQGTYSLTDTLKFTGGIRYTWDLTRSQTTASNYTYYPTRVARCANPRLPAGAPLGSIVTDPLPQCFEISRAFTQAPTWVVGLDWKPIEEVLLYAKYSRGYRQGSTNPLGASGFNAYGPEKVDTYEAGVKANWRGPVPGFINVAGFYNDFSDQQLNLVLTAPPGVSANAAIVNVGKSRIQGVEVEAGVTLFQGLRLDAAYAYLDSKLTQVTAPSLTGTPYTGFIPLVIGQPAPLTPKHKYALTANYTLPLDESVGRISFGGTYSFIDDQTVTVSPFGTLPSYHLLNLNFDWRGIASSPIDLAAFATNVTKERYFVQANDNIASRGFASFQLGAPRMYGVRLRYNFGR